MTDKMNAMKKWKKLAILMMVQVALFGTVQVIAQDKNDKDVKTDTLKCWVSMDCENCKAKIEKNLPFEKGVTGLKVDLPTKIVMVAYKKDKTSPEKLEKAIQKLGYKTEIIPGTK
jgi:periplasmic mercuric ion binding protein